MSEFESTPNVNFLMSVFRPGRHTVWTVTKLENYDFFSTSAENSNRRKESSSARETNVQENCDFVTVFSSDAFNFFFSLLCANLAKYQLWFRRGGVYVWFRRGNAIDAELQSRGKIQMLPNMWSDFFLFSGFLCFSSICSCKNCVSSICVIDVYLLSGVCRYGLRKFYIWDSCIDGTLLI